MNLIQIQDKITLAKGYKAICDSRIANTRHHFDDDLKFYQNKKEYYDQLIQNLYNQRSRIIKRRIATSLAVAHVVVIGVFLMLYLPF